VRILSNVLGGSGRFVNRILPKSEKKKKNLVTEVEAFRQGVSKAEAEPGGPRGAAAFAWWGKIGSLLPKS